MRAGLSLGSGVVALGVVSLLTDLATEMIVPVLPLFLVGVLGAPATALGLVEGIADATASFAKAWSGRASDRSGRRGRFVLVGYAMSAVPKPLLALAGAWPHVLALRFADRFGKGVRGPARDALLAERSPPDRIGRAFGFHRALDTMGAVLGSAIASFLLFALPREEGTFRLIFLLAGVPALLAVIVVYRAVRDADAPAPAGRWDPRRRAPQLRETWALASPELRRFLLAAVPFGLASFSVAFLLLRASDLGLDAASVALGYVLLNLAYALVAFPAGALSDRVGRRAVLGVAFALYAGLSIGFAFACAAWQALALLGAQGVFLGLSDGAQRAYASELAPPGARATVLGAFAFLAGALALPASLLAGILYDVAGPSAPFFLAAALSGLSLAILTSRRGGGA